MPVSLKLSHPVERALEGCEVAPTQAFLERRPQQIGRMKGRQGLDVAAVLGPVGVPPAAGPQDPVLHAEEVLRRRSAEADQEFRAGKLDLPRDKRLADG